MSGWIDDDAALVQRARAGSDAAFSRLVARHQGAVRAFARRLSVGGWAEADDLAQEAFVSAWSSLGALRDPAGFRTWLLGIVWRRAQDRIRSGARAASRDRDWLESQGPPPAGIGVEDRMALDQAMSALAPDVRACVALCLGEGLSHGEAAQVLNLPLGTVKSHVNRGRARVLKALGGEDDA